MALILLVIVLFFTPTEAVEKWPIVISAPEADTQPWWSSVERHICHGQPYIHVQLRYGPLGAISQPGLAQLEKLHAQYPENPMIIVDYAGGKPRTYNLPEVKPGPDDMFDNHAVRLRRAADVLGCLSPYTDVSLWYFDPRYRLIPVPHTPWCDSYEG